MAEEIGGIKVKITADTTGLDRGIDSATNKTKEFGTQANKNLAGVDRGAQQAQASFNQTGMSIDGLIKRIGALAAAYLTLEGVGKIIDVTAEFQKLEASLVTVTGSTEAAAEAFDQIKLFASETPFALTEVTDAFIKMQALGLKPSEEALRSYGDTASSMGKSLNQMVEAVADAATGEFERLKEFGIRASQQGDQVALTFGGVTTTINKNANEIQKYLIELGEANFAGGMTRQMETVGGQLSNLSDQWDKTFAAIGNANSGLIGITISGIASLGSAIEDLFLTAEEWAVKYGHIATEAEKISTAQRVVNIQIEAAQSRYENLSLAINNLTQGLTEEQLELVKTSDYYKDLQEQLRVAGQEVDSLQSKFSQAEWGTEDQFEEIEKSFEKMAETNAEFAEMMARDRIAQDELYLEHLKEFHEAYAEELEAQADLERDLKAKLLEIDQEHFLTKEEIAAEQLEKELESLALAHENKLLSEEEYLNKKAMLEEKYANESQMRAEEAARAEEAIEKAKHKAKIEETSKAFANLSVLMNTGSRELFAIGKAAAIANAVMTGHEAAVDAFKGGLRVSGGNPAVGAAFAAASLAATGAQIASIRSTQIGGSGSVSGGTTASTPTTSITQQSQPVETPQQGPAGGTLTVQGLNAASLFSGDAVAQIAEELLDYQRRGGSVLLQG